MYKCDFHKRALVLLFFGINTENQICNLQTVDCPLGLEYISLQKRLLSNYKPYECLIF
jgi:hypothetical protein